MTSSLFSRTFWPLCPTHTISTLVNAGTSYSVSWKSDPQQSYICRINSVKNMFRFFRIIFSLLTIGIILYSILSLRPYRVDGDSMLPYLKPDSISIIDRVSPRIQAFQRGEIVVYRDSKNDIRIKRIIGLPWEILEISEWIVSVLRNNIQTPLEERYLEEHMRTCVPGACTDLGIHLYEIPEWHYFVLWDNRTSSRDSRWCTDVSDCRNIQPHYISQDEMIGRVIFSW